MRTNGPGRLLVAVALAWVGAAACSDTPATEPPPAGPTPPPSTTAAPAPSPQEQPAVLVGAGDIATCTGDADTATAALVAGAPGTVFTLGDNAYPDGSRRDFARCYRPSWGRFKERTRPVAGNHEYRTAGAAGHFGYFGAAAGRRGEGWYAYDAGAWRVVVLNSNCGAVRGGCGPGSPQERWLRAELGRGAGCAVAMWHHPVFTSGVHPPSREVRPLFRALYEAGVEILLTGHNHQYERIAPQDPSGRRDDARGVRAFVVGTGGAAFYGFPRKVGNSEVRHTGTHGVLRLTLRPGGYEWRFLPVRGHTFTDSGQGTCH